ncbi:PAS domain S-box protein [Uliginosibacterium sp. H3]|uniref:histidine kinase n=1 Tax=Uliginosibacterium silvisoli TaxID=3114758 RepID=A0ABU6K0W2_9RHOO|nr:PAS domain S-box protein [Uliginosibacterium sp. H3]
MDNSNNPIDPELFKLMVEQTKDYGLFMLDPLGHVVTWNLGAQLIKGYFPDEIIGSHFSRFYTREAIDRGWPQYELKVAAAEGRFEDEGWRLRKDGSRFWASVVITALRGGNGELLGFSKITRDLTERKMNEEALRQSEERFRLLIEGVTDYAIYMLSEEGIITSWNTGAERIKGYAREEILGKHFSRFYRQEDIDAGKPWHELQTAKQVGRAEEEGWRLRKNGEAFWARVVVSALYDGEGRSRGFAKVTQDLTERRHMQDLEKAAQNIHEFIATLAHELRNPLAPIRAAAQTLQWLPEGDPRLAPMIDMLDRQSRHMTHIIDDLIDVTRIGRGMLSVEHTFVDIADIVRQSLEATATAIEEREHTVEIDTAVEPVFVSGDHHRLNQLVTNLLSNAARYTAHGGRISISGRAEGGNAIIEVRDTGKGIEADMMGRIFDMFVQGRGSLESAERGLGIGLALARKIAELHGGALEVFSDGKGKGSTFTLRLPRAEYVQASAVSASPEAAGRPVQPRRRVLIVDDNADAAESLHHLLQTLGHETYVASSGAVALEMVAHYRPEIVLLDIGMPGMDGYETARRLRQLNAGTPTQLRIVAISGWGQEPDRAKSREAGLDLHLLKPVELPQLIAALAEPDRAEG